MEGNKWSVFVFQPVSLTLIKSAVARRWTVTDTLTAWCACCEGSRVPLKARLVLPVVTDYIRKPLDGVKLEQHAGVPGNWKSGSPH